jgi:hypothetical protein
MATKKTWVWIIVIIGGVCIVAMLAIAAAGVMFVSNHIEAKTSTTSDAFKKFDAVKAAFKEQRALFELDQHERPRMTRTLTDLPAGATRARDLHILAWDPNSSTSEGRLVTVSLPFWLLKLGHRKVDVLHNGSGFDLERLDLDIHQLERVGPLLVVDHQTPEGERVLVWTR